MATVFKIQAAQSSGTLSSVPDVSGNGFAFTPGTKPVLGHSDAGGNLIVLPIDHVDDQNFGSHLANDAVPVSLTDGFTFLTALNIPSSRTSRSIGPSGNPGRRTLAMIGPYEVFFDELKTDPTLGTVHVQGPTGEAVRTSSSRINIANVIGVALNTAGGSIWHNGVLTSWAWTVTGAAETGVRLGTNNAVEHSASSTTATFQIREAELQDTRLSDTDLAAACQSLITQYGIPTAGKTLDQAGDSLGALFDGEFSSNALINSGLHLQRPVTNWATAGNTLFGGQRTLFDNYGPTLDNGDLLIQAGSNDIAGGRTAAQMAADETDFIANRVRGVIDQVYDMTITPRTDFDAAQEAVRLEVNAARIAREDTITIDIASRPEFQDPTDLTYFSPDGVHYSTLGHQIIGNLIAAAIPTGDETLDTRPWTPDDLIVPPLVDIRASNFANNATPFSIVGSAAVNGDAIDFSDASYLDLGQDITAGHLFVIRGPFGQPTRADLVAPLFGSSRGGSNVDTEATDTESSFVNYDNTAVGWRLSVNGTNTTGLGAVAAINGEVSPFDNDPIFDGRPYVEQAPFGLDTYSVDYQDEQVNTRYLNALVVNATTFATNAASQIYGYLLFENPITADDRQRLEGWAHHTFAGNGDRLIVGHPYRDAAPRFSVILDPGVTTDGDLDSIATSIDSLRAQVALLETAIAELPDAVWAHATRGLTEDVTGGTGSAHTPADVVAAFLGTSDTPSPENSPLLAQIERQDGKLTGIATEVGKIERSENPVEAGGIVAKRLYESDGVTIATNADGSPAEILEQTV